MGTFFGPDLMYKHYSGWICPHTFNLKHENHNWVRLWWSESNRQSIETMSLKKMSLLFIKPTTTFWIYVVVECSYTYLLLIVSVSFYNLLTIDIWVLYCYISIPWISLIFHLHLRTHSMKLFNSAISNSLSEFHCQ